MVASEDVADGDVVAEVPYAAALEVVTSLRPCPFPDVRARRHTPPSPSPAVTSTFASGLTRFLPGILQFVDPQFWDSAPYWAKMGLVLLREKSLGVRLCLLLPPRIPVSAALLTKPGQSRTRCGLLRTDGHLAPSLPPPALNRHRISTTGQVSVCDVPEAAAQAAGHAAGVDRRTAGPTAEPSPCSQGAASAGATAWSLRWLGARPLSGGFAFPLPFASGRR